MTRAEQAALEYLADPSDPFSSLFELHTVLHLWDEHSENLDAVLSRWLILGWVTVTPAPDAGDVALVSLTDAGHAALAAVRTAS